MKKKINEVTKQRVIAWILLIICMISAVSILVSVLYKTEDSVEVETQPIIETIITEPTEPEPTIVETEPETEPTIEETVDPKRYTEYKNATYIYETLKANGYNDYVACGVLGNVMAEVGGGSLSFNVEIYDGSGYFYGMCQWNRGAYGQIHGEGLEAQVDFLLKTIKHEFDVYGPAFDTSYEEFCSLCDEKRAALQFARIYERCASFSHSARQDYATRAYEYFVNN